MFPSKLLSQFAAIVIGGVYKEEDKSIFGREDNWVLISFPFFKQIFLSKLLSQFAAMVIHGVHKEEDRLIFGREHHRVILFS